MSVESKSIDIPKTVKISGDTVVLPATQIVKTSGEAVLKKTAGVFLFSGYLCDNTLEYSGAAFNNYEAATFVLEHLGDGSGVRYNVRGYAITGISPYLINSGALYDGETAAVSVTGAYEYLDIGVENLQDNFSGIVSVIIARR